VHRTTRKGGPRTWSFEPERFTNISGDSIAIHIPHSESHVLHGAGSWPVRSAWCSVPRLCLLVPCMYLFRPSILFFLHRPVLSTREIKHTSAYCNAPHSHAWNHQLGTPSVTTLLAKKNPTIVVSIFNSLAKTLIFYKFGHFLRRQRSNRLTTSIAKIAP
jgi:hypothetical protein